MLFFNFFLIRCLFDFLQDVVLCFYFNNVAYTLVWCGVLSLLSSFNVSSMSNLLRARIDYRYCMYKYCDEYYIHLYSPKLVAIQQTNYKHNTMKERKKTIRLNN